MRRIAIVNASKKISNKDAITITAACDYQLNRQVAPAWGMLPVPVTLYKKLQEVPPNAEIITLLDNADIANALGYHDETPNGRPYGRVFVGTILQYGGTIMTGSLSASLVLSHEVLEQFADPNINLWAENDMGVMYALEICDQVEEDSYEIPIGVNKVSVSNFVFPEWFDSENKPHIRYDKMNKLRQPFSMTPGGYVIVKNGDEVTEIYGAKYPEWKKEVKKVAAARTFKRKLKAKLNQAKMKPKEKKVMNERLYEKQLGKQAEHPKANTP
jgi:hypothetical protein